MNGLHLLLLEASVAATEVSLPSPPTSADFREGGGFLGTVLYAVLFLILVVGVAGWRILTNRDASWFRLQENKDIWLRENMKAMTESHEKTLGAMADAVKETAAASTAGQKEVAQTLRDLQKEVGSLGHSLGEQTMYGVFRKALSDELAIRERKP